MDAFERQKERIRKKLLILVEGETCVMENLSNIGMKLVIPFLVKKRKIDIHFQYNGYQQDLIGEIRWIHKEPTVYDQASYMVGVELLDPPPDYVALVEKLLNDN